MSIYLIPIKTAMIFFPFLAALFTLPYIIIQYRKYGSISFLRSTIIFSFIFYLLCAYLLTILPLPKPEVVAKLTTPTTQFMPFQAIQDLLINSPFDITSPATYLATLNSPTFYILFFNIILLLPFGIYLRYYFTFTWKKTLFYTFLISLSFECIQRSALFGIYPRPYRTFDVDDLIFNTLGGMLGYMITPLLAHRLPSREELDERAYHKGIQVSFFRRSFAFLIDVTFLCLGFAILYAYHLISYRTLHYPQLYVGYLLWITCLFVVIPCLSKGKTIGKYFVRITIRQTNGESAKWYQYIIHYLLLYGIILPMPFCIYYLITQFLFITTNDRFFYLVGIIFSSCFYLFTIYQILNSLWNEKKQPFYAQASHLHNLSTILSKPTTITEAPIDEVNDQDHVTDEKNNITSN